MKILHLDLETYSRVDIRSAGAYKYCEDEEFEILWACWRLEGRETVKAWSTLMPMSLELQVLLRDPSVLVYAHNAEFEYCALKADERFPTVPIERMRCTAAIASSLALPRALGRVAQFLGLDEQKDSEGTSLINRFCKPRKPSKNNPSTRIMPSNDPERFNRLGEYCKQDVVVESAIYKKLKRYELGPMSLEVFHMTMRMNERGFYVDMPNVKKALKFVQEEELRAKAECKLLCGIYPTQVGKLREWVNSQGVWCDSLGASVIEHLLKDKALDKTVRRVLEIRQICGKSSTKKLASMIDVVCKDGRAHGCFMWHGANTGRWAGKLIQPHNMVNPSAKIETAWKAFERANSPADLALLYDNPMDALSTIMRHFICSEHGVLDVCDYSSIEPRVLCWLAGQHDILKQVRAGVDIYVAMASRVFRKPGDKVTSYERKIGKFIILGCGYQMSAGKFQAVCAMFGVDISIEEATTYVNLFRNTNKNIVSMWYALERACKKCIQDKRAVRCGKVTFFPEADFVFVRLPSGRKLAYPFMHIDDMGSLRYRKPDNTAAGFTETQTYGGKLTENITQAVSADIMAFGMLVAERRGHNLVGTVHDEGLADNPPGMFENFRECLCTLPKWAQDIPVEATGYSEKRYRKD